VLDDKFIPGRIIPTHNEQQEHFYYGKPDLLVIYIAKMILQVDPIARHFLQSDDTLLAEVLRALYGFPGGAKLWNEHLTFTLVKGGYTQWPVEPCLLLKSVNEYNN
jgi:hypothetical protein